MDITKTYAGILQNIRSARGSVLYKYFWGVFSKKGASSSNAISQNHSPVYPQSDILCGNKFMALPYNMLHSTASCYSGTPLDAQHIPLKSADINFFNQ